MGLSSRAKSRLKNIMSNSDESDEIIEVLESDVSFSVSEEDTGKKWIDGKPIFRKVIVTGATGGNQIVSFAHGISTIETLVNSGGSFKQSDGDFVPIVNSSFNANDSAGINSVDDTNINFWIGNVYNGDDAFVSAVVWLEYTKA